MFDVFAGMNEAQRLAKSLKDSKRFKQALVWAAGNLDSISPED